MLIQNTQCQLGLGPSPTPTSRVSPPSEDRTPALWRTLFLKNCFLPQPKAQEWHLPPSSMIYRFLPFAGVNLSKACLCNGGPGPNISRPHSPPLSSQQTREGSPEQEVLRQGAGRDSQEGSPTPLGKTAIAAPPPHFRWWWRRRRLIYKADRLGPCLKL